ncbi:hypothetical protein [[Acholeplasma] multilocale]|uniref:hypothetical protein n=1 Tax=[Acholeplasma] multilocale TaxID=264638 RepID=UPI00244E5B92|nr:hypothetical protein [[Acholeplasma] multilocale]
MSASQYSSASSVHGFAALPCMLLGSYTSDKFKSRTLLITALVITSLLGLWYMSLPFNDSSTAILWQLYVIFVGFAFASGALLWAPLWKIIKNHNTEDLEGAEKEKKVGRNNGIQGTVNGLIGLVLALLGILLLTLSKSGSLPTINIGEKSINTGFFVLVTIYVSLIITSLILTILFIKGVDDGKSKTFSVRGVLSIIKSWKVWLLGILILGVYMLQMGLASYTNYLTNTLLISTTLVSFIGVFRTYVMRVIIANFAGRKADNSHSYIFWITIGLIVGVALVVISILLPGFSDFKQKSVLFKTLIQIASVINVLVLGLLTWALVTIRWSPIGTELNISNENYGAGVSIVSVIAFTPNAFFKAIKSGIESKYWEKYVDPNTGFETKIASQLGNQIILLVVVLFGILGIVAGAILYVSIYRKTDNYIFKRK